MIVFDPCYPKDVEFKEKDYCKLQKEFLKAEGLDCVTIPLEEGQDIISKLDIPRRFKYDLSRLELAQKLSKDGDVLYLDNDVVPAQGFGKFIDDTISKIPCGIFYNPGTGFFVKKGYGHLLNALINRYYDKWPVVRDLANDRDRSDLVNDCAFVGDMLRDFCLPDVIYTPMLLHVCSGMKAYYIDETDLTTGPIFVSDKESLQRASTFLDLRGAVYSRIGTPIRLRRNKWL